MRFNLQIEYIKKADYDKSWKSKKHPRIRYYSKKAMKKLYPNGIYKVSGGIGDGMKDQVGTVLIKRNQVPYYTTHYNHMLYSTDGYIEIGELEYLAIVRNRITSHISILLAVFLSLCCVVLAFYTFSLSADSGLDNRAKDFTPKNMKDVKTDPNHIAFPGYGEVRMKAGSDTLYLALWNPPKNPCYFQFVISMEKSGEVLFKSKLIAPGKAITEVKLNRKFKRGTYNIMINMNTFDIHDKSVKMNSGNVEAKLVVLGT